MFDNQQGWGNVLAIATDCQQVFVTRGLGHKHLLDTFGFGFVLGQRGVGLTLSDPTNTIGFGFGINLDFATLDFLKHDLLLLKTCFFTVTFSKQDVTLCVGHTHFTATLGFGATLFKGGFIVSDRGLGLVFTGHCIGFKGGNFHTLFGFGLLLTLHRNSSLIGDCNLTLTCSCCFTGHTFSFILSHLDTTITFSFLLADGGLCGLLSDADILLTIRSRGTNGTFTQRIGLVDLGLVNGLGGGFLTQRFDVTRLIHDVTDVHVDHFKTDFVQLEIHILVDQIKELFTILIDLFNRQCGNDQTHLTEDDVACLCRDVTVL